MNEYKVGDQVRWIRAAQWRLKDPIGIVEEPIAARGRDTSQMYRVKFQFGSLLLYGNQLELAEEVQVKTAA
jgi:hypothetical protein